MEFKIRSSSFLGAQEATTGGGGGEGKGKGSLEEVFNDDQGNVKTTVAVK